jgi:O-antigen/teichoic acid export membrane protein
MSPYIVSLAVGRPDITVRQNVLALFIVVPASALAIYYFGLNGAGFSWVLFHIYAYSYGLPRICRECIGIAPRSWYWHVLRILGSGLLIYGITWELAKWLGNFSILSLVAAYVVGSILYGAVAYGMMGEALRARIRDFLTRGRGRVAAAVATP